MKKAPAIILAAMLSMTAFAQNRFQQDSSICFSWDTLTDSWLLTSKTIYTYDANGNRTSELQQHWNGTAWDNNYQYIYTYDVNGNQTSELYQKWNGTAWVNNEQWTATYNANGNRTSYLSQRWVGTAWVNNSQYTYT